MKTLILNGSPSHDGDISVLIAVLTQNLQGENMVIDCYSSNISPCQDCRCCREQLYCPNEDAMRDIYGYLTEYDNLILASPIHYAELSSGLLKVVSRFQVYSSALIFRHEQLPISVKRGAVLLAQGGSGGAERAYETAKLIFQSIGVKDVYPLICSANTDRLSASEDENAIAETKKVAEWLNSFAEPQLNCDNIPQITWKSPPEEKIILFRSLFRGREDVYALRYENPKNGKHGYTPVCENKWKPGICDMQKTKCPKCPNRRFAALDDKAVFRHLSGQDALCRDVIGIYPMFPDETTYFLAIDFDDGDWQKDISAVRNVCKTHDIPCAVERSRSGEGGHLWVFFESPLSAAKARKLGSGLLTQAMKERHEIKFDSYDRMFPNQDTMPSGGFGNLIALPLQKQAVKRGNSVFIDEYFMQYRDQWGFLSCIRKMAEADVDAAIGELCEQTELGELYTDDTENADKPWELIPQQTEFFNLPDNLQIVFANMLYIPKSELSQKALNKLKRLACFKNQDFYRAQGMRMSTYGKPHIISLACEDENYLMLPRGCRESLESFLTEQGCKYTVKDERMIGREINVEFNGELRADQQNAVETLLQYDTGVLAATTAFGKTVAAIGLIAARGVNVLILVHTQALLQQWKKALEQFLIVNEALPEQPVKRGRRKKLSCIGQLGGSKNTLSGIVDIAIMQSMISDHEVKQLINDYGMIIVDECHHVSAESFESVLKEAHAKYVYGLTATPKRSDGHQPIIFMQCGPIRYSADAKEYAAKHSFSHILVPRFTKFRADISEDKPTITEVYKQITESEYRNSLIVNDVKTALQSGRTPIIISERMTHIRLLAEMLTDAADHVFILSGQGTAKAKRELLEQVHTVPKTESVIILATGKYAGEGFDEPRLDTLFLAMPISWSGTLSQYVGRLHRDYEGKSSVMIYDYADIHVHMLENMYKKRLRGYAKLGYAPETVQQTGFKTIYTVNYDNDLFRDITSARKSVIIAGSYFASGKLGVLLRSVDQCRVGGVKVLIITKKSNAEYAEKLHQILSAHDITHLIKNKIQSSFVAIDGKTIWYASGELFGNNEDDCVLRIEDEVLAGELAESIR
ncbi:MAG: DEAD/DEAH box helicase family protein [Ruminococcus sp.]|nr:DEAD/DEAH box helicase family protein [Ruminococcus sp.]